MLSRQFFLSSHVYLCVTREGVILLDLKQDEYLGLGNADASALSGLVQGWPIPTTTDNEPAVTPAALLLALQLKEKGLLTEDQRAGKQAQPTRIAPVSSVVACGDPDCQPRIRLVDTVKFFFACAEAALALRFLTLERVVQRVNIRKLKKVSDTANFDMEKASRLVGIFLRLRPFAYAARDRCLYDSLALVEFLSRYDIYPSWVFGVMTRPFAAHSWVQEAGFVFNSSVERAREFTPVLVV